VGGVIGVGVEMRMVQVVTQMPDREGEAEEQERDGEGSQGCASVGHGPKVCSFRIRHKTRPCDFSGPRLS